MDFKIKQQLVESIASEVNDLHPLLNSILGKLPSIKGIEYTHGTQEKGADFVLTKLDETLDVFTHIGVVVKKGKITNDISDVERQITECTLPRLIDGGKKKVRLSEIWVVNTSSISSNAKDKIYENYVKQRIEFIDGNKLTHLIDRYAEYFWHQVPSVLGSYLSSLNSKIESEEKESGFVGNISCNGFYVTPDIQEIEKPNYTKKTIKNNKQRLINITEEVLKNKVSIIQAEMGFGKSKTLRKIIEYYSSTERYNEFKVIPIHMSFRKFYEQKLNIKDLIEKELKEIISSKHDSNYKLLIALDGIDEAAVNGCWRDFLRTTISDAKNYDNLSLVMTTRPLRVLDEEVDIFSGCKRYLIRPLSISKIISFIENACKTLSIPKKIYDDLQRSDLFKQLPQSPIAAALLSSLLSQNQNDLPSNLTELYSKSIEYMLGRWDVQKGIAPEKEYLTSERVVLLIAQYMVSNQLIWMSFSEAKQMLKDWHSKRNTGVPEENLYERVFNKSGIFTIDEEDDKLSFRHRSFGEYLYAKAANADNKLISIENSLDAYWVETTFFYIGIKGDCPEIIENLFNLQPKDERELWLKILCLPDYSLAGYQTEYSIVESNLYSLFIQAAKLYNDIKSNKIKSKLVELSEMHLLWFFQRIIRYCYNYEYLKPSISTTILNIHDSNEDISDKMYALFFASCFAAQLDDSSGFEFLVTNYSAEILPLQISMAIEMETRNKKDFSKLPLIKAHEKRLRSLLASKVKANGKSFNLRGAASDTDKRITELFETPLRLSIQKK